MSACYFNRESSWLEFNARVLDEALDATTPLLERLRFLSIFSSNLDEFFMVRVAGLLKMREEGLVSLDSPSATDSESTLEIIRHKTLELSQKQHACFMEVMGLLEKQGVKILRHSQLDSRQRKHLDDYYHREIYPVLTPLSYDAAHPFPFLTNLALYLVLIPHAEDLQELKKLPKLCFVEIPSILSRLIPIDENVPDKSFTYVLLEDLIAEHLGRLFVGVKFKQTGLIRVTRNLDYTLLENDVVDLLKAIKKEVIVREQQEVVKLEMDERLPSEIVSLLMEKNEIQDQQVYYLSAPMHIPSFVSLCSLPYPELKYENFNPRLPSQLKGEEDIFSIIGKGDILVHHPYESFYTVTEFLKTAASDPSVLAIKQNLYRTGGDSPIIRALIEAAEQGKHVTAVVELKARFDEKNNISWARELQRAGVNVVFGFVELKTHSKATLVVRREAGSIRRYVHLSTGNYNSVTAKIFTDIGLFTTDERISDDVSQMFNLITGIGILRIGRNPNQSAQLPNFQSLAVAPLNLRSSFLKLIDEEIEHAKKGRKSCIVAKMNALVDLKIIDKLYEASQAGVKIDLIVRGICCLIPGVRGLSENISVISIIDRFLEHSRIFYFYADGIEKVYLSSADWMPRNMDRRVEILWPIETPALKRRIVDEVLALQLNDNIKARVLKPDGTYQLRTPSAEQRPLRSQFKFIELARREGIKSLPYDKALKHNPQKDQGKRPVRRDKKK